MFVKPAIHWTAIPPAAYPSPLGSVQYLNDVCVLCTQFDASSGPSAKQLRVHAFSWLCYQILATDTYLLAVGTDNKVGESCDCHNASVKYVSISLRLIDIEIGVAIGRCTPLEANRSNVSLNGNGSPCSSPMKGP